MNTEDDSAREPMMLSEDQARRAFLKKAGRFAVVTPPAITLLLGTSLDSRAIAKSSGGRWWWLQIVRRWQRQRQKPVRRSTSGQRIRRSKPRSHWPARPKVAPLARRAGSGRLSDEQDELACFLKKRAATATPSSPRSRRPSPCCGRGAPCGCRSRREVPSALSGDRRPTRIRRPQDAGDLGFLEGTSTQLTQRTETPHLLSPHLGRLAYNRKSRRMRRDFSIISRRPVLWDNRISSCCWCHFVLGLGSLKAGA